jgi:hypothetical protein
VGESGGKSRETHGLKESFCHVALKVTDESTWQSAERLSSAATTWWAHGDFLEVGTHSPLCLAWASLLRLPPWAAAPKERLVKGRKE